MDKVLEERLKTAANLKEMLVACIDYYKLEDVKPGAGVKGAIIYGLKSAFNMTNPKRR